MISWEMIRNTLGHFHPAFVHFPVGLLLTGAIVEFWSFLRRRGASPLARAFLLFGFLGTALAVTSGLFLFHPGDFRGRTLRAAEVHRFLALASLVLAFAAIVVGGSARSPATLGGPRLFIYRSLYYLTATVVGLTGHYGGWIVFGWGSIWIF